MVRYLILSLICMLILSCDSFLNSSSEISDNFLTSVELTDTLRMELNIMSEENEKLEEVEAQFILKNISEKEVVYKFSSGCQYGYTITKNHITMFDSRKNLDCAAVLTQLKLKPDQTRSFPISLDRFDINKQLEKGVYELEAFLLEGHADKISVLFKVE